MCSNGDGKTVKARGLCSTCWSRWYRNPDRGPVGPQGFQPGNKVAVGNQWNVGNQHRAGKGPTPSAFKPSENPSYDAIHQRLRKTYGPAKDRECVDCGGQAYDWSYDRTDPEVKYELRRNGHGDKLSPKPYSWDLFRYEPRCKSCHTVFDSAAVS